MSNSISVHYNSVMSATYNYNNITAGEYETVTGQETGIHTQQTTDHRAHTPFTHIFTPSGSLIIQCD